MEKNEIKNDFSISILSAAQFHAVADFLLRENVNNVDRIIVLSDLLLSDANLAMECQKIKDCHPKIQFLMALPEILRRQDQTYLQACLDYLYCHSLFTGVLTGNLEGAGFFHACNKKRMANGNEKFSLYGDHSLYLWNSSALGAWKGILDGGCLPLELRDLDQNSLLRLAFSWEKIVYGRIPMMVTANCVAKTAEACSPEKNKNHKEPLKTVSLRDRMGKDFPVRRVCRHCYNVIYNSIPLSLHGEMGQIPSEVTLRLQFTTENEAETRKILRFFLIENGNAAALPYHDFTKGHEKRGAL